MTEKLIKGVKAAIAGYFRRREYKRKRALAARMETSLSDVMLELILMLSAGLTLSSAAEQLAAGRKGEGPLYDLFAEALERSRSLNTSMFTELYSSAADYPSPELLRFFSLLLENYAGGAGLCERLELERRRLHSARLSSAEARAREAETRLVFPLMILLIVITVISVAPALMALSF